MIRDHQKIMAITQNIKDKNMKEEILNILQNYLEIFKNEKNRQSQFLEYLNNHKDVDITDWNNFDGHIVSSGFLYALKEKRFLVLYHKDQKMYLYPGGHIDKEDKNILEAAMREVREETGISDFKQIKIQNNPLIPIDIDTHKIPYNERLDLPEHYHFDFRYLFVIESIEKITIDQDESSEYKWINMEELKKLSHYGMVLEKIEKIIK